MSTDRKAQLIGFTLKEIGGPQEYRLLAQTLYASCNQSAQLVRNYTKQEPKEIVDYATLWRITMGIYHSGCGCMGDAIEAAWDAYDMEDTGDKEQRLQWLDIVENLDKDCQSAADYFDKVVRYGS